MLEDRILEGRSVGREGFGEYEQLCTDKKEEMDAKAE